MVLTSDVQLQESLRRAKSPTPPRASERRQSKHLFPPEKEDTRRSSTNSNLNFTPDTSIDSPNTSLTRKRVEFSHLPEYQESPKSSHDGSLSPSHFVQRLPPSAERKTKIKSILKVSHYGYDQGQDGVAGTTGLLPPHHFATFAEMLESICQQLAGGDRSSKMDAYLMLTSSLKASENEPDLVALGSKMVLLQDFMKRDQTAKNEQGKLDSKLVIQSLQLLSSFLHKQAITQILTNDFTTYILEHSIKSFLDRSSPKDIIKNLLFVLSHQDFAPSVLTQERLGRLLNALHNIEQVSKGKSIVTGRIDTYRRLIRQSRSHMLSNTVWLDDLFTDMLSSIKEVRSTAISFGLEASFSVGREDSMSRAVIKLFNLEHENGEKFAIYYFRRLKEMVRAKQDREGSDQVPRIWSVIVLFIRSKPRIFEQWAFLNPLLEIVQLCFNTSDVATQLQANYAWNRFVYAVSLDPKTGPGVRSLLGQALSGQLKHRKSLSIRQSTFRSVYNLLYYALRPNSLPEQTDLYWDEYIFPLVGKCMVLEPHANPDVQKQDIAETCNILQALFNTTTPRLWSEDRAMKDAEKNIMTVEELPALDSRWLRRNPVRAFAILSPLLEKLFWDLGDDDSGIRRVWLNYLTSIQSPSKMEVKVSIQTMTSIASIFSSLYSIWNADKSELGSSSIPKTDGSRTIPFLQSFENLITTLTKTLGILPFTEKLLSISQDTFIAVATPSHQPKKIRRGIKAPLHHLFLLLTTVSPGLEYDRNFSQMVHRILAPFFNARATSKSQMELVSDLLDLLPLESNESTNHIWQALATFAASATDTRDDKENSGTNEQPLGASYRSALKVLEIGMRLSPHQPLPGWKTLLETLATSATLDAGDGGKAIAIIEPLAKAFTTKQPDAETLPGGLLYYHLLVSKATYPKDQQALEAARRRVWATGMTGSKASFDPYTRLYEYMQLSLESSYASSSKANVSACANIITATTGLLCRCPTPLLLGVLVKSQHSLALWIMDNDSKLTSGTNLSKPVLALWSMITTTALPQLLIRFPHTQILADLETLICSGLESKHRTIVNSTIAFWNSSFGTSENSFEYPDRAKAALLRIHSQVDIQLPFFPESLESEPPVQERQPLQFSDTQNDSNNISAVSGVSGASRTSITSPINPALQKHLAPHLMYSPRTRLRHYTPQVVISSSSSPNRKRTRESTPTSNRKPKLRDTTPRLRHDDSQVQFEAIESSPMSDRVLDSQLLTDKQKEVKERQEADAAMFPDFNSTSISKGKSIEIPEPELPAHRPLSERRLASPAVRVRQMSPNLIIPSDDDNFIPSSPTPTPRRFSQVDADPPSSPPDSMAYRPKSPAEETPPSSSEATPEPMNDVAVSFDPPSRQMDPYSAENNRPVSTYNTTSDYQEGYSEADPNSQLQEDQEKHDRMSPEDESLPESVPESAPDTVMEDPQPPPVVEGLATIVKSNIAVSDSSPASRNSAKFMNAMSSPASSDKNADVFQDAHSSPRLNATKPAERISSPLSEIDESSMLRLMTEYDRSSGQSRNPSSEDKENQPTLTPVLEKRPEEVRLPVSTLATPFNSPNKLDKHPALPNKDQGSFEPNQISSFASQIPDPIPSWLKFSQDGTKWIIDGEELDPEDTIIVDCSVLEDEERPRYKKASPRKRSPKKRKLFQTESFEVPESQEVDSQQDDSPSAKAPAAKRRKGRSTRSSQSQELTQSSQASSRIQSPDNDISMAESTRDESEALGQSEKDGNGSRGTEEREVVDSTGEPSSAPASEPAIEIDQDIEMATSEEPKNPEDVEAPGTTIINGSTRFGDSNVSSPSQDLVEETILGSSSDVVTEEPAMHEEPTSPVEEPATPDVEEDVTEIEESHQARDEAAPEEVASEDPMEVQPEGQQLDEPVEGEVQPDEVLGEPESAASQPEAPMSMLQSVKHKLSNLIGDLKAAVLSKREVHELEDMFMDAKRTLYDAELRGREAGNGEGGSM